MQNWTSLDDYERGVWVEHNKLGDAVDDFFKKENKNLLWSEFDIADYDWHENANQDAKLMKKVFQELVKEETAFMYAYDPHHPAYKFNPYLEFEQNKNFGGDWGVTVWPIPVFPNGDWSIFCDSTFSNLYVGVPQFGGGGQKLYKYQGSIFILGAKMVQAVKKYQPPLLREIKNSGVGLGNFVQKYGDVFARVE